MLLRKKKVFIPLGILLVLAVLLTCLGCVPVTEEGGVRFSLLCALHPESALTSEMTRHESNNGEVYYIISNPPYVKTTDTHMTQWNIHQFGVFYWAQFGFC